MSKKLFSQEEIQLLEQNPNVLRVTPKHIEYTTHFKQLFWKEYCAGGKPTAIMRKYGFNPEILGRDRIYIMQSNIKHAIAMGATCYGSIPPEIERNSFANSQLQKKYEKLLAENKFLKEQLEFLKKIISLETLDS